MGGDLPSPAHLLPGLGVSSSLIVSGDCTSAASSPPPGPGPPHSATLAAPSICPDHPLVLTLTLDEERAERGNNSFKSHFLTGRFYFQLTSCLRLLEDGGEGK